MDKEMIRAYLWQDIIRLGFCPSSTKDQKSWLLQFGQSLKEFWETDSYPNSPSENNGRICATIDCASALDLCLEYSVESRTKFSVTFMYSLPLKGNDLMWVHDVDGGFFTFPAQLLLTDHGSREIAAGRFSNDDVEAVLDGLLVHPAVHLHIKSPIQNHEIRLGGGIDNPFLYLFQLRYQFCPHQEKRQTERNRLVELFTEAIRSNSPNICQ